MGNLTEDMTRLCADMQSLHESRQALREALAEGSKERQEQVREMCAYLAGALTHKARQAHKTRLADLNNLKQAVAALRQDVRGDLALVRHTWAGMRV